MAQATQVDLNDLRDETMGKKAYLKPAQRRELEETIARNQAALTGYGPNGQALPIVPGVPVPDAVMIRENVARDQAMLDAGTPPKLSELQIRKRLVRLSDLEAEIKQGMPSIDQMWRPLAPHVDAAIAHSRVNKTRILARKSLLSEIDPENDDPNFRSVELLRSSEPPRVDLRQYWRNLDLVKWKTEAELAQEKPIDEETFGRFCLYKAADWSAKSIRRELALTEGQYAQAMTRLQDLKATAAEDEAFEDEEDDPEHALKDPIPSEMSPGPPPDRSFGLWFKGELRTRQIVLRSVAERLGISQSIFSFMLANKRDMSPEQRAQALALLEAFDRDPSILRRHEVPVTS